VFLFIPTPWFVSSLPVPPRAENHNFGLRTQTEAIIMNWLKLITLVLAQNLKSNITVPVYSFASSIRSIFAASKNHRYMLS